MPLVQIYDDYASTKSLEAFVSMLHHLLGSGAASVKLENSNGTIIRTVSTSTQLFEALQTDSCLLKLLLTYLRQAMFQYKDGGLTTALLATNLILKTKREEGITLNSLTYSFSFLIRLILDFIHLEKVQVNIGKFQHVKSIIQSILLSKLDLTRAELNHLCVLYSKVFSQLAGCIDRSNSLLINNVVIYKEVNSHISSTKLLDGYLLRLGNENTSVMVSKAHHRFVVVNISLSFDSEDLVNEKKVNVNIQSKSKFRDSISKQLEKFCLDIIPHIDLIICQKVVHPFCKQLFENADVTCIDRVGLNSVKILESMYNCKCLSFLVSPDNIKPYINQTDNFEFLNLSAGKSYLMMAHKYLKSLIIHGKNENEVDLINHCFETSMFSLDTLIKLPHVIYGAGCTTTKLCVYLLSIDYTEIKTLKQMNCSIGKAQAIIRIVVNSLLDNVQSIESNHKYFNHSIDTQFYHHWINQSERCCCGAINNVSNDTQFINIKELIHSYEAFLPQKSPLKNKDAFTQVSDCNVQFLPQTSPLRNKDPFTLLNDCNVQSLLVYKSNVKAAFEIAESLLRVGSQLVQL